MQLVEVTRCETGPLPLSDAPSRPACARTVGEAIELELSSARTAAEARQGGRDLTAQRYLLPWFADAQISSLSRDAIRAWMRELFVLGYSRGTASNALALLRDALDGTLRRLEPNPAYGIAVVEPPAPLLATDEVRRIQSFISEPDGQAVIVALALGAGLRHEELADLEWDSVLWSRDSIRVLGRRGGASGRWRDVQAPSWVFVTLWRYLFERPRIHSRVLAGVRIGDELQRLRLASGVPVSVHALRDVCLARWAEAGMRADQLQRVGGLDASAVRARYGRLMQRGS